MIDLWWMLKVLPWFFGSVLSWKFLSTNSRNQPLHQEQRVDRFVCLNKCVENKRWACGICRDFNRWYWECLEWNTVNRNVLKFSAETHHPHHLIVFPAWRCVLPALGLSEPAQYARADNTNDQVVVDAMVATLVAGLPRSLTATSGVYRFVFRITVKMLVLI